MADNNVERNTVYSNSITKYLEIYVFLTLANAHCDIIIMIIFFHGKQKKTHQNRQQGKYMEANALKIFLL